MSSTWREVLSRVSLAQAWAALGGGSIERRRARAFWRGGDGLTVSIDLDRGLWHDFKAGKGGGIVDLVMLVLECDKAAALRWLAQLAGVALKDWTPAERAEYARYAARRKAAEAEAAELVAWKDELLREIAYDRIVQWKAHHRAQRALDAEGCGTDRGMLAIAVMAAVEKEVKRLDGEYDRINNASWEQLLPEFRASTLQRVTA